MRLQDAGESVEELVDADGLAACCGGLHDAASGFGEGGVGALQGVELPGVLGAQFVESALVLLAVEVAVGFGLLGAAQDGADFCVFEAVAVGDGQEAEFGEGVVGEDVPVRAGFGGYQGDVVAADAAGPGEGFDETSTMAAAADRSAGSRVMLLLPTRRPRR